MSWSEWDIIGTSIRHKTFAMNRSYNTLAWVNDLAALFCLSNKLSNDFIVYSFLGAMSLALNKCFRTFYVIFEQKLILNVDLVLLYDLTKSTIHSLLASIATQFIAVGSNPNESTILFSRFVAIFMHVSYFFKTFINVFPFRSLSQLLMSWKNWEKDLSRWSRESNARNFRSSVSYRCPNNILLWKYHYLQLI